MKLTRLASSCEDGDCPTIYATDRGTVAIQGSRLDGHGLLLPEHESVVEIPVSLLRKAVRDRLV
ncbi:hypothetical protein ACIQUQ_13230 [Streptomyces sp. NPDC101118]|uniref:hypothetical protein n=1 Tax=Streptomyces sp. NPDC101118 TaxID=3366109 RepID=UPI00380D90B2